MDEQVTEMLSTLNEGLQGLPEYASKGWDVLVMGTRLNSLVWAGFGLVLLIIGLYLRHYVKVNKKEMDAHSPYEADGRLTVANLFLLAGCLFVLFNINPIILPEYTLIKSILP